VKKTITTTCSDVLGPLKYQHKEWLSTETLRKIQERKGKKAALNNSRTRAEKAKAQTDFTAANKEVKKRIRTDKRNYVDGLAAEAASEKAARNGNMKDLHSITKMLSGKFCKPGRPVKDKEGKILKGEKQQMDRWREHFEELLNRQMPANPSTINPAVEDLPIDCSAPPEKRSARQ